MATARGAVAGRTDGPGSAAGDRGDDLVLLGFRNELATVEDVHAVDLLRDGAAGGAGLAQDALGLLDRGARLFGVGGVPLHDLMAAAIGDDDASHRGLLSLPEGPGRDGNVRQAIAAAAGRPDDGRGAPGIFTRCTRLSLHSTPVVLVGQGAVRAKSGRRHITFPNEEAPESDHQPRASLPPAVVY